ncbi:MAG: hypothetical protein U9Q73_01935 [Nanoarchaeota archaeon]|nr:hypothetical protein [Nanoarchaeota archaeon]
MSFIGGQGTGKSVLIRYLVELLRSIPDYEGLISVVATNDPRVIGDKRYSEYFEGKHVLVIVVDDAIGEGTDSRRSMSGDNVEITQQFCVSRHVLEDLYEKNGIIFFIFAVQVYSRLDATLRENSILQVYTSYYDLNWFHKIFTPEQSELLRLATWEGQVGFNFDALRFCLAKAKTGQTATIEVPYSSKEQVKYDVVIDRSIDEAFLLGLLKDALRTELERLKCSVSDFTRGQLKGFLYPFANQIEQDYTIKVRRTDLVKAIEQLDWEFARKEVSLQPLQNKDKIFNALHQEGVVNIQKIVAITGLEAKKIRSALSSYKDELFENIERGIWCLKDYTYTEDEVRKYLPPKPKKLVI